VSAKLVAMADEVTTQKSRLELSLSWICV